jgi:sulfur carrier protein ThiS
MQIEVKLGGGLKRYAAGPAGRGAIESDSPITVAEAIARLGVEEDAEDVLAIVNDEVVPPSDRRRFTLKDRDQLTLIPQLKGG